MDTILPILSLLCGIGLFIFTMFYMFRALRDAISPRHALARQYCIDLWNQLKIETSRSVDSTSGDIILTCFHNRDTVTVIESRISEIQKVTGEKPLLDSFEGRAQLTFVNTPTGGKREETPQASVGSVLLKPTTG